MYYALQKEVNEIEFEIVTAEKGRYKKKGVCDDIFTFDTETTNSFIVCGVPKPFNYDNPKESKEAVKHSLVYIWQATINECTFYGRDLKTYLEFLGDLYDACPFTKFVYVHNFAFDFVFLQNIINFSDVFARTPRHPITARAEEYAVEFRCSYVLTNMSLDEWGRKLDLQVKKKKGLLDYRAIRTPYTPLTTDELEYCFCDVQTMYCGLLQFKKKYKHVYNIPLTHTGEMRRACEEVMADETGYNMRVTACAPCSLDMYLKQCDAFIGGTVLCNWLYKNRTIKGVDSYDIASSYPWALLNFKYPLSQFFKTNNYEKYINNPDYLYIVKFVCTGVESRLNCHFLSKSKGLYTKGAESDNGRIIRADEICYCLTSVDFEIFKKCYEYEEIEIKEFLWCKAGYLSNKLRKFILDLYVGKTTLKGIEGEEAQYMLKKQFINSVYGDFVTKVFSRDIKYDAGEWGAEELTEETFNKKLKDFKKKKYKNYKAFSHGVFCTAWARSRLWAGILSEDKNGFLLDEKMVYCDTDSLKVYNYTGDFFNEENKRVLERHKELAREIGVDVSMFAPLDKNGNAHPIGVFEYEGTYKKFRSTGCKQYLVEENGKLKLTCAGVSKKAVACFKRVEDFKPNTELTEKMLLKAGCEKLMSNYSADLPVVEFPDGYVSTYKYGVNLMPTTFNISITPEDLFLLFTEVKNKQDAIYYSRSRRRDY